MDYSDKTVLITGGSRGIGLATARLFLREGANVVIGARTEASLAQAMQELGPPERVRAVGADVSTVEGCETTVDAARQAFGSIDLLFTNAGNYLSWPIEEMSEDLWDMTVDTHLKGTFFCIKFALRDLRQNRGAVVTMASDAGLGGLRGGWSAYCAAKGGIIGLTRQLAADLAPDVRVNCIAPGPVGTEHLYQDLLNGTYGGIEQSPDPVAALAESIPLKRIISPEDVAEAVAFVAAAESMTGAVLSLDGGTTAMLP